MGYRKSGKSRKQLRVEEVKELSNKGNNCMVAELEELSCRERGQPGKYPGEDESKKLAERGAIHGGMVAESRGVAHTNSGWRRKHPTKKSQELAEKGAIDSCLAAEAEGTSHNKRGRLGKYPMEEKSLKLAERGDVDKCMVAGSESVACSRKRGRPRKHPRQEQSQDLLNKNATYKCLVVESKGISYNKRGQPRKCLKGEEPGKLFELKEVAHNEWGHPRKHLMEKEPQELPESEEVANNKRGLSRKHPREEQPQGLTRKDAIHKCVIVGSEEVAQSKRGLRKRYPREEESEGSEKKVIIYNLVSESQKIIHKKRGWLRKHSRHEAFEEVNDKGTIQKIIVKELEEVSHSKQGQPQRYPRNEELPDKCAISKHVAADSEEMARKKRGQLRKHHGGIGTFKEKGSFEVSEEKRLLQGKLIRKHKNSAINEVSESSKPVAQLAICKRRSEKDVENRKQNSSFLECLESSIFLQESCKIGQMNLDKQNQNTCLGHDQEILGSDQCKILRRKQIKGTRVVECMEKEDVVQLKNPSGIEGNRVLLKPVALGVPSWRTRSRLKGSAEQLEDAECNQKSALCRSEELLKHAESQLAAELLLNEQVALRRSTRNSRECKISNDNLVYWNMKQHKKESSLNKRENHAETCCGPCPENYSALKAAEQGAASRRKRRKFKDLEESKRRTDIENQKGIEPFELYLEECNQKTRSNLEECTEKAFIEGKKISGHHAALEEREVEWVKENALRRRQSKRSKVLKESMDVAYIGLEQCKDEVSFLEMEDPLAEVGCRFAKGRLRENPRGTVDCEERGGILLPAQNLLTGFASGEESQDQDVENRMRGARNIVRKQFLGPEELEENYRSVKLLHTVPEKIKESVQQTEQIVSRGKLRARQKSVEESKQPDCEEQKNFCKPIGEAAVCSRILTRSSKKKQQREFITEEECCKRTSLSRKMETLWKYQQLLQGREDDQMDAIKNSDGSDAVSSSVEYVAMECYSDIHKAGGSAEEATRSFIEAESFTLQPLPPSSRSFPVPEVSIAKLFAVYSFLRSFSRTLFLSPFSLEDLLTALCLEKSNILVDSVHASLLQALRRQLERPSIEEFPKAKLCLRQADWNFLDVITWPLYLIDFISTLSKSEICELKIGKLKLSLEYYRLSISTKLDILSLLCDHVMETDEIRAEINMREVRITNISELDKRDPVSNVNQEFQTIQVSQENEIISSGDVNSVTKTRDAFGKISEEDELLDGNSDECVLCGMNGNLICCDGCPAAYHGRCVGISKGKLPPGDWFCPECVVDRMDGGSSSCTEGLRGSKLLGVDSFSRIFMGTCGYLLVCEPSNEFEFQYKYYPKEDLPAILQFLENLKPICNDIQKAIIQHWEMNEWEPAGTAKAVTVSESGDALVSAISSTSLNFPSETLSHVTEDNLIITSDITFKENEAHRTKECKIVSMNEFCNPLTMTVPSSCAGESGSNAAEAEVRIDKLNLETADGLSLISNVKLSDSNSPQEFPILEQFDRASAYINHYVLGDIAATAAANLALMNVGDNASREKSFKKKQRSTTILKQLKAFSQVPAYFYWPSVRKKLMEIPKERCGWCFSCINPTLKKGCLLNLVAANQACGAACVIGGIRPAKNNLGHLSEIGGYLLYMEESLRNVLIGPWENVHYRKMWRKKVDSATSASHLKTLLLELESNIRPVALLEDWYSPENTLSMGSGTLVGTIPSCPVRKRLSNGKSTHRESKAVGKTLFSSKGRAWGIQWQRCGNAFCEFLDSQRLPILTAREAGRQGGLKKINGLIYTEGCEFPSRSVQCAWRSKVESTRTVSQLAVQIRHLDTNIRWNDLFESKCNEKIVIYSKIWREGSVMYLTDSALLVSGMATKQKPSKDDMIIPEQDLNGERLIWVPEMQIPLSLLSGFEERLRLSSHSRHLKLMTTGNEHKNSSKIAATFSCDVLLERLKQPSEIAQKSAALVCHVCMLELTSRVVAHCQVCQASCHGPCAVTICLYTGMMARHTCLKCFIKIKEPLASRNTMELDKQIIVNNRMDHVYQKVAKENDADEKLASVNQYGQHFNTDIPSLREKLFKSTMVILRTGIDNEMISNSKQGPLVQNMPEKMAANSVSVIQNSRVCHNPASAAHKYVLWRKNNMDFRSFDSRNVILPLSPVGTSVAPCCSLCKQSYDSKLLYIACERCSLWFHGDSLGVTQKNFADVIVFKCHKCRKKAAPYCLYSEIGTFMQHPFPNASAEIGEVINATGEGNLGDVTLSKLIDNSKCCDGYDCHNDGALERDSSESLIQNCDYGSLGLSNVECLHVVHETENNLSQHVQENCATKASVGANDVLEYMLQKDFTAMDLTSFPLPLTSSILPSCIFPKYSVVEDQKSLEIATPFDLSLQSYSEINDHSSLENSMALDQDVSFSSFPLASETPMFTRLETHSSHFATALDLDNNEVSTTDHEKLHIDDHVDFNLETCKSPDMMATGFVSSIWSKSEHIKFADELQPKMVGLDKMNSSHMVCVEHVSSSHLSCFDAGTSPRMAHPFTEFFSSENGDVALTLDPLEFDDSSICPDIATALSGTLSEVVDNPLVTEFEI